MQVGETQRRVVAALGKVEEGWVVDTEINVAELWGKGSGWAKERWWRTLPVTSNQKRPPLL